LLTVAALGDSVGEENVSVGPSSYWSGRKKKGWLAHRGAGLAGLCVRALDAAGEREGRRSKGGGGAGGSQVWTLIREEKSSGNIFCNQRTQGKKGEKEVEIKAFGPAARLYAVRGRKKEHRGGLMRQQGGRGKKEGRGRCVVVGDTAFHRAHVPKDFASGNRGSFLFTPRGRGGGKGEEVVTSTPDCCEEEEVIGSAEATAVVTGLS